MSEAICRCGGDPSARKPLAQAALRPATETVEPVDEVELEIDGNRFPTDRYKPLRKVGKGGAGEVYLARDRLLFKLVAVKVLHELTAEQLIGFQSEARALANLSHPAIIELLDFGPTPSGTPYMVLEYFPGVTLADYIQDHGPLDELVAMRIFAAVAEGLALAHSLNILHRDISASNLLIQTDQDQIIDVKLIDFGVAQIEKPGEDTAQQGTTLAGTPAYMSPDVANGLRYDQRSEIYSFGCLLFEALTGEVPFLGRSVMETINMHAHNHAPMLRERSPKIFLDETEAIVANCLEKEPADRFQDMSVVQDVLLEVENLLSEFKQQDKKPVEREVARTSRNWTPTLLVVALLGAILWIAIVQMQSMKQEEERKSIEIKKAKAKKEKTFLNPDEVESAKSIYGPFDTLTDDKTFNPIFTITGRTVHSDKLAVAHSVTTAEELDDALENYPQVTFLKINLSNVDDAMTHIIEEHKTITDLNLRQCKISLPNLKRLVSLKRLISLRLNNVTGSNEAIKTVNNPRLTHLEIREGQLDEQAVQQITSMKSLVHLEISASKVSHNMIDRIAKLPALAVLHLDETGINDEDLVKISEISTLYDLSIAHCGPFEPGSYAKLKKLPLLRKLWVNGNKLNRFALSEIASLSTLQLLDVAENKNIGIKELRIFKGRPGLSIEVDKDQVSPTQVNDAPALLNGTQMDLSSKALTNDE